jgi:hypothetical protein
MGIVSFFKKLIGDKVEEPLSDYERLTISPSPGLQKHRERVGDLLARAGLRIERRDPPRGVQAVGNVNAVFDADAERQEMDYYRRQSGGVPLVGPGRQFTVPDHLK